MEKNDYPAVLVLSALREDPVGGWRIVVFADSQVLEDEEAAHKRRNFYDVFEGRGALPYDYSLTSVDRVDEVVAEIRAELEAELEALQSEAGHAATPPAPKDPPANEEPANDNTTAAARGQLDARPEVALIVKYQGTGASVTPTGPFDGATCELVGYEHNGQEAIPPDDNPKRMRDWLKLEGYHPHYPDWKWLDRGHGPRRRREVYRYNGASNDVYDEVIDAEFLRQMYEESQSPRLAEAERAALYRRKALAGEGVFAPCRECPLVQACPHGWGACDRKAAAAQARNAEIGRSRSNKNPRYQVFYQ